MERYFTYLLELMQKISIKKEELKRLEGLKERRKQEEETISDKQGEENIILAKLMHYEEESETEATYHAIPMLALFLLFLSLYLLIKNQIFNLPLILTLVIINGITLPICKIKLKRKKEEIKAKRSENESEIEERKEKIEELSKRRHQLRTEIGELDQKAGQIKQEIKQITTEYEELQSQVITKIGPYLDKLIELDITLRGNTELEQAMKQIREKN